MDLNSIAMPSTNIQTKDIKTVYYIYLSMSFMWTQDKFLSLAEGFFKHITNEFSDYDSKGLCPN